MNVIQMCFCIFQLRDYVNGLDEEIYQNITTTKEILEVYTCKDNEMVKSVVSQII